MRTNGKQGEGRAGAAGDRTGVGYKVSNPGYNEKGIVTIVLLVVLLAAPCWADNTDIEWNTRGDYVYLAPVPEAANQITVNTTEIEDALALAVKLLDKSCEYKNVTAIYRTPSQELRDQASRIEERDKAIEKIRDVYQRFKTINEAQAQKGKP